jgi:hypothetical protein
MDWQQTASLAIVAVTVGFMWCGWRETRRRQFGASGACGCGADGNVGKRLRLSGRKGERPRLTVSM